MKIRFQFFAPVVLGLLLCYFSCIAQDIHFDVINPPKDNPWQLISGMSQEPQGFLWLASYTGVYRYDGRQFIHYFHDPKNSNSIADNRIECILADKNGIIWIGTYVNGLDRLNPATGIITHFRHIPKDTNSLSNDTTTALMQDKQGIIWIGTYGGLDRFNPQTKTFTHYSHIAGDPSSLSNNQVRAIYEDQEGTIWIGTGSPFNENAEGGIGGLNRFDPKTGTFKTYLHNPNDPNSIADNRVRAIFEDRKHNFWIGTAGDGLQTLDRATGVFTHFYYDSSHPEKLSRPPLQKTLPYVDDHITFITEDATGKIWIGTIEGGINVYNPSTKKVTHYGTDKNSREKLPTDQFWYAYKTRDGIIWISTWGATNGIYNLYKINPYENKLPYHYMKQPVYAFAEDSAHTLWLGTSEGLIHKDSSGKEQQFFIDKNSPSLNVIICLAKDKENKFWAGTPHGLYHFDPITKKFTRYHHEAGNAASLICDTVISVSESVPGKLWVGTVRGLDLMDIKSGTFKHFQNDPKDSGSISNDVIQDITTDNNNNVWIGTNNGLDKLDGQSGHFKKYLYTKPAVICMMQDSDGNLWAGTSVGFYKYAEKKDSFLNFIDASGVIGSTTSVFGITEDHQKNLWLNTSVGIIKLNVKSNTAIVYGPGQGVNESSLTQYGYTRQNGEILYGNRPGYFGFHPEQIMHNIPTPTVSITNFLLASKPVIPAPGGILPLPLSQTKNIHLSHKQNTFSFEFTSIDYISTGDNHLQYMLENYDHGWQRVGENNTAYYFNIPPGNYVFKVKAQNDNGVWAEKDMIIIISPPWWATWWAITIFALILIIIIWAIIYYRSRQLLKENKILEEKVNHRTAQLQQSLEDLKSAQKQLVQSEKMASLGELTAGIAHEIQNPLNFVNNFSEVNKELLEDLKAERLKPKAEQDEQLKDDLINDVVDNSEKINHHGKRAGAIVTGMLQHSRTSTGQKEMTNINALAEEYLRLSYHGLRAKDKSFNATMKTDFDESIGKINIIPQDIGRVLLNLFNNAFYAASLHSKGGFKDPLHKHEPTVWVSTKRNNDKIEIKVKDNGNGIPQNIVDKIFQPFFTTKPTGEGTGLGLSLAYDIVKAHGGELKVETLSAEAAAQAGKEGEGTEFIIQLPI